VEEPDLTRTQPGRRALPDNVAIAVYALRILGGATQFVHTEDVALKCFELVPERFSWRRYPQYPDGAPARFALEDAKKPKYGHLTDGNRGGRKNRYLGYSRHSRRG
jgi:hypothetical protein